MAGYSTSAPPVLETQSIAGRRSWRYESVDAAGVVDADGYITNASDLGMKVGDRVIVVDTDASPIAQTEHIVSVINADGSADLSDGVAIGSTNSD